MVLCSCLGPTLGMVRGTQEVQRRFILLSIFSFIGSGSYMAVVMPRYLVIRARASYQPELFDGWEKVLAARIVLYTTTILSLHPLFALQSLAEVRDEERPVKKC
ncbi:unnamed protein product [Prorocentrum cordatum]|uniref:Uncharacterized protein n=1 Tax=Prorocentrum cordatum TaxID=2364126 RepID=A0ABN9VBF7_9DINO|nr:unnamed protein product [Polarella glacialis]